VKADLMNHSFVPAPTHPNALPAILSRAAELLGAANYDGAITLLLSERQLVSREPVACNTLAYLLVQADRPQEAVAWFEASLSMQPNDGRAVAGLGMALQASGNAAGALQCYERAVMLRPDDANSWYNRGVLQAQLWQRREALFSLDRSISLRNDYAPAFAKRSHVLESLGDLQPAIESAVRCCTLAPGEASSWSLLGDLLQKVGNFAQAIAAYERALKLSPDDIGCISNMAVALKAAGRIEDALECGRAVLKLDADNPQALLLCGNVELKLGNTQAARASFLAAAQAGVACSYPATPQPAKFRALMLFSPFAGNTPYEDLIKDVRFDANLVIVLENHHYDIEALAANADVVVNLISDADLGLDMIGSLSELVASLRKPVINHPALILGTDRQSISRRLSAVRGVVMPTTVRLEAADLLRRLRSGEGRAFPVIVRHAGTHGGEKMEVVADPHELQAFAETAGDQPLYLTDFVDYSSADGHFRKYRLIFVGEEIFPYHLAIGDGWKVHHISTRMGELEWMRNEEQAFLETPAQVFGPSAMAALDMIRRIIGLDYFGIDCSVDANGNVVVFEVNATMLIHLHNDGFEYKTPHVMKIKAAFERLLEERANGAKAPAPTAAAQQSWKAGIV
jgi:tetratricopeptide (TPR) repeat protein/glutathione synthase/RimK-type ligase-like ATP-grasp enzyme